jgi:hypothetical protein
VADAFGARFITGAPGVGAIMLTAAARSWYNSASRDSCRGERIRNAMWPVISRAAQTMIAVQAVAVRTARFDVWRNR